jgi:hypothetical protein
MIANQYAALIKTAKIRKADRTWFSWWIYRYASSQGRPRSRPLSVHPRDCLRAHRLPQEAVSKSTAVQFVTSLNRPGATG